MAKDVNFMLVLYFSAMASKATPTDTFYSCFKTMARPIKNSILSQYIHQPNR